METSPEIGKLADALVKFQHAVSNVKKDGKNPFFNSKYATLENIIDTIRVPLHNSGLAFSQFPDGDGLTTVLMHLSGEFVRATSKMTPKDDSPQAQGSAITYMRRYALSAVLGIATEEDDDGNAASAMQRRSMKSYDVPKKAEVPLELSPKDQIKKYLKNLGHEPKTVAAANKIVKELTDLPMTEDNYTAIIEKLWEKIEQDEAVENKT